MSEPFSFGKHFGGNGGSPVIPILIISPCRQRGYATLLWPYWTILLQVNFSARSEFMAILDWAKIRKSHVSSKIMSAEINGKNQILPTL